MPLAAEARGMPPPHYPSYSHIYNNHKTRRCRNGVRHDIVAYPFIRLQSLVSIGTVLAYTSAETKQNRPLVSI